MAMETEMIKRLQLPGKSSLSSPSVSVNFPPHDNAHRNALKKTITNDK